ncbi:M1 family metallopeptidase [Luteimonas sp. SX5]|uniref:M1 family metallopeptidase n=1 Tax=Luteimonas galliterrae TaxID=2940486 RepID=A0ABT0MH82_9GAMM|nr:M1 family metallopeptidase [Luteimonas galliterrae]MCL1634224.1 M1 family metallopeptidase [Luteimonas galliterrae]
MPRFHALTALGLMLCLPVATAVAKQSAAPSAAPADTACKDVPFAAADAAAVSVPSAADAWGGPRKGDEATLSDRVVRYDIHATLDPVKHTIDGKQKLTWRNRSAQPVCAVYLHMYLNAFESANSTFMTEQRNLNFAFRSDVPVEDGDWGYSKLDRVQQNGQAVRWRFVQPDGGPSTDRTVVRLDLPQPVAPGASTTLDIDFFNQLPRVTARTGYFGTFHLVAQWFPKIGVLELPGERGAVAPRWNVHEFHMHSEFYADFGEYDVRITVPKGYTVGATGEETGAPVEAGGKITHRFVQNDVHDFAWTADNRYAKPLDGFYEGPGSPRVKVRVLYPPEYESNAKPALQATIDSLAYFSRTLGPYPYKTVTVVIPPFNAQEAGGMEYPTFFTASSYKNVDPDTLARYGLDFVTIHEFGHGYFYGILASNEFEEPMLDEGLNEYWDQRMLRERKQRIHATTPWLKRIGFAPAIDGFDGERLGAMTGNPADALGQNSWNRMSSRSYGTVYSRTATTMHDLEQRVGKEALERAFKLYYARWKFRHPSIADFRDALIEGTGQRETVERIFAQQVYATRKVDDSIAEFSSEEALPVPGYVERGGKRIEVTSEALDKAIEDKRKAWKEMNPKAKDGEGPFPYRTTVLVRRDGADVPQVLRVTFADGSSETVHWNGAQPWQRFSWVKRSKAVSAQLDPDGHINLDSDKLDDGRTLDSDRSATRRWVGDITALLQNFFAMLVSL